MKIEYYKHLLKSGYNQTALEAFSETLKDGNALPFDLPYSYDDEVIVCLIGTETVGVLTFWVQDWNGVAVIRIVYVKPEHRRKGIHTAMYDKLKRVLKKKGIKYIYSGVGSANLGMIKVAKKQGRELIGYLFLDTLEVKDDDTLS